MTTFFVGQRVRVARRPLDEHQLSGPYLGGQVGDEGIVAGTESAPNRGFVFRNFPVLSVLLDRNSEPGMAPAYCFEPVLPSGHTAGHEGVCEELDKLLAGVAA